MTRDTKARVEPTDETALDAIYREHLVFVCSVLRRLGVDEADIDDASQDVFVVAHRRLGQFEGRAAVRTWLYSIAIRVASNRRRKRARRDGLMVRLPPSVPDDLEDLAARGQARAILEVLLGRLDDDKRVVFVLAELEELTVPAIADLVGENPRTVYSRLRAARARVATELERLNPPRPIDLAAAVVATRPRAEVPVERARRGWAAVLAKLATGGSALPVASAGLGLAAKVAIALGLIGVTAGGVHWAARPDSTAPTIHASPTPSAPPLPTASASPAPAVVVTRVSPAPSVPAPPPPVRAQAVPREATPRPTSSPAQASLGDEIAAIDRARALLQGGRADAAIAELDRYTARFARGELRREADGVRVAALCAAGRLAAATELARVAELPAPRCEASH